jgi:hypothetical protein
MEPIVKYFLQSTSRRISVLILALVGCWAVALMAGCGSDSFSSSPGSKLTGNTSVTLFATSTANDKLSQFTLGINSVTLVDASGKTVTLQATPQDAAEFISVNGAAAPLLTTSVPQDVYTSASVSIGGSTFACVFLNPSDQGLADAYYSDQSTAPSRVTVNLPAPITVTGTSMGLALNLLVQQSAVWSSGSCSQPQNPSAPDSYTITPTFYLTPVTVVTQPTNTSNGEALGLLGLISSLGKNGASFTVATQGGPFIPQGAYGPIWTVTTNGSTLYQGISSATQIAAGMAVDMDVAVQSDGSLLATRVAVYDRNTKNLGIWYGPLAFKSEYVPAFFDFARDSQGAFDLRGIVGFSFGSATFLPSGQFTNLPTLPFTPSFTARTMVAGQNILVTSHATTISPEPVYIPATTVTLVPQTLNGTVDAIGSSASFTTYTITLAPYDLFAALATQPGQATQITHPTQVVVYVDNNTQVLSANPPAVGGLLRFYGLVFNDRGTLRMDCAQISDGVKE